MKSKLINAAGPVAVFLVFIALWYVVAYSLHNNFSPASGKPMIIPPPHRLFEDFHGPIRDRIFTALLFTAQQLLPCIGKADDHSAASSIV